MLMIDEADIGYKLLLLSSSLFAEVMALLSIIGYFISPKPRCKTAKYQAFGALFYSFSMVVIEITYIVPSSMVLFNTHLTMCKVLGLAQFFGEDMSSFYIIGVSVNMLLSVLPKKIKGRCVTKHNQGKMVFVVWTVTGTIYCSIFVVICVMESVVDVRGSRCWLKNEIGKMPIIVFQFISYRGFATGAALVALVLAIICKMRLKRLAEEQGEVLKSDVVCDAHELDEVQVGLAALDKSLFRRFVVFMISAVVQAVISNVFDIVTRTGVVNDSNSQYFGWFDMLYIVGFSICGFVFTQAYIEKIIEKIFRRHSSSPEDISPSYGEFVMG